SSRRPPPPAAPCWIAPCLRACRSSVGTRSRRPTTSPSPPGRNEPDRPARPGIPAGGVQSRARRSRSRRSRSRPDPVPDPSRRRLGHVGTGRRRFPCKEHPMSKLRLFLTLGMAVVLALASPLVGQSVTLPATGGGFFYVIVNGDTVSQHTTERAAAAAAFTAQRHDTLAVVTYDTKRSTRVVVSPGFFAGGVDTVVVDRPILAPLDTVLVYPLIGGSFRAFYDGSGYREIPADTVTPPPTDTVVTPPVDTVTPPPVDTVTPPPVDTTPPIVVPPPTASARLLVTPERLATWRQMIADGHHLAVLADANCKGNRYGDTGLWCAWWYMATGDQA